MTEAVRVPARAQGRGHQQLRDQLSSATWVIPAGFAVGAFVLAVIITRADALRDTIGGFGYLGDRVSAETMLAVIATAMLAFIGVVFSITIVALQLASGQLSPRVMRIFQRDRRTQIVLGIFLATFVFSLSAIAELGETRADIAPLMVGISGLLVFASLGAFVFFEHIAQETRRTIEDVDRPDPPVAVIDARSIPRVLHPMPTWAALVDLAFEEVRWFGRESIQISRRLFAIVDDLEARVGPERHEALAVLRTRIREGVEEALPESLYALAMTADHLGIGGDSS